jgi:hypothetical protein
MTFERSAADISGRDVPAGAVVLEEGPVAEPPPARLLPGGSIGRDSTPASDHVARLEPKRRFEPEGNA